MGIFDDNPAIRTGFIVAILGCVLISGGLAITGVLLPEWVTFECKEDIGTTESPFTEDLLKGNIGLWELCLNYNFTSNLTTSEVVCSRFKSSHFILERPEWMKQIMWMAMPGVVGNCLTILMLTCFALLGLSIRRQGAIGVAAACAGIGGFYLTSMIVTYAGQYRINDITEEFSCPEPHVPKGLSFDLMGWACAPLLVGCLASLIAAGLASPIPANHVYRKLEIPEKEERKSAQKKYILPGGLEHFNRAGPWDEEDESDLPGNSNVQ